MELDVARTALVITDPQNDFLSEQGVAWELVGASVVENDTINHLSQLLAAASQGGLLVVVSPHYYYPTDHDWQFGGALEQKMHEIGMFDRTGPLSLDGFEESGADWYAPLKPYIENGRTVVVSPHKVYGPQNNDVVLQLRKRRVDQEFLADMSANLCVESHLRHLLEQGFEIAVVMDATAAARPPEGDGDLAALINFRFIANALWSTDEAVERINGRA